MNELSVKYELPKIAYDLTELKGNVEKLKKKYAGIIVQKDDVSSCKREIADLNKLAKSINDKKIDIGKQIKEPLTKYESEVKEIIHDIQYVSSNLKIQVDLYANKAKEDKRKQILAHDKWRDFMLFNDKWLNKTFAVSKIIAEMEEQQKEFDLRADDIASECVLYELKSFSYIERLNKKQSFEQIMNLVRNDGKIKKEYKPEVEKIPEKVFKPSITNTQKVDAKIYSFTLKISGTRYELQTLKDFLLKEEIIYEKVIQN